MAGHKERFLEIDLLRTVAILMMIVYHICFDLAFFYDFPIDPLSGWLLVLQRSTAILFLLLVGISFSVSFGRMRNRNAGDPELFRKYFQNGIGLILIGEVISIVTWFAVGDLYVRFGILHLIGASLILAPLFMPLREANLFLAPIVWYGGTVLSNIFLSSSFLLPLGITRPDFNSIDYFPLFPWFAAVLTGMAAGNFLYNRGFLKIHIKQTPVTWRITSPGRHSLMIYLLHQPILLGFLKFLGFFKIL